MRFRAFGLLLAPLVAGCATPERGAGDSCRSKAVQYALGRELTKAREVELLKLSHSREIRVTTPEMIVTTEYRLGRLTVDLTSENKIYRLYCS